MEGAASEDLWLSVLREMYRAYYNDWTHINPAFRGQLLQSAINPDDGDKLPQQVAECMPCWDLLRWHALRIETSGLSEALRLDVDKTRPGCLMNVFSPRMETVFREAFADFFIGACMFGGWHLTFWLDKLLGATSWSVGNHKYWSEVQDSLSGNTEKRAKAIAGGYRIYEAEIRPEVTRTTWCDSYYYTFLAYVILLDCDDCAGLVKTIWKLQSAAEELQYVYWSTASYQMEEVASKVSSVATRVGHCSTVKDLFSGRSLLWTHGGFCGISCPGAEVCCDEKSIVAIVDGLSFPVVVCDYDEATGEGSLAGCALIRGVDMLNRDSERAVLPPDYERGEKRIFKFR